MDQHLVIAISREYGSGGREIGERLAEELGIAYYDKLLLKRIAEESGLDGDVVADFDEKPLRPLLLNPNAFFCATDLEHPVASRIYRTEVDILRSIADESSCVIVGRCADYVLAGHPDLVSLFVSAPMEARVARVMRRNTLSASEARSRIARVDKNRASYYRYFTDENWGMARNYDLCINSGDLDATRAVSIVRCFLDARS
ncbi:AAA family ATPase [Enteroscipio rubneri]|uniref:Cytidylate kinase-like family protein n=1 Tax=Enteroscipio rubneri TaxID=2070686 RepID=A0A2K2UAY6_9ACTN|nr:cytidylate kinase-like family protein [Enteroscipio rubneri]PNV67485.1 cytidylate kinase-like family protein [Enteroscipio rubneri]